MLRGGNAQWDVWLQVGWKSPPSHPPRPSPSPLAALCVRGRVVDGELSTGGLWGCGMGLWEEERREERRESSWRQEQAGDRPPSHPPMSQCRNVPTSRRGMMSPVPLWNEIPVAHNGMVFCGPRGCVVGPVL